MTAGPIAARGARSFLRTIPIEVYPLGACMAFAMNVMSIVFRW
ncbi:2788_t:CDS:2 [Funneliformis mosseae]|uniref:2788_t:CDS:1 n=1 Tax=Funneliformis mosseae TaxID=27381 RepID=A0A9N8VVV1_FUNMO|nr:2788_t:CDS:2 [Funneliformis mosseae]